ncbi:protein of unknown function [Modestobacter italicus]|uniref:Uncharacterized protein n=1 Tax=Modestobacter italicus (strain DSM 44449 / CECT 9708 / BC 501) TaxID=2732864 RepID=I4F1V0_MODI5|nr:protein of unknown function [Modestobacter marinus]
MLRGGRRCGRYLEGGARTVLSEGDSVGWTVHSVRNCCERLTDSK